MLKYPTKRVSFADEVRYFWQEWNIRIFVLFSQLLRIVLCFLMPRRKSSSNSFILLLIKVTYVLSYIVAGMALTYLSNGRPTLYKLERKSRCFVYHDYHPLISCLDDDYRPPLVFWASFIIFHVCGDGPEMAYTIDEYETWYKHMLNFIAHDMAMFFVILLQRKEKVMPTGWVVTVVVAYYVSYVKMKNLWGGRSDLRALVLVNRRREVHNVAVAVAAPRVIEEAGKSKELDEVDLVNKAFKYYDSTKKLFVGLSFTRTEREQSRKEFLELNPKDAVNMVEIELNIAYEAYYTMGVVDPYLTERSRRCSILGFIYRGMCTAFFAILGMNIFFDEDSYKGDYYDRYKVDGIITRVLCFSTALLVFMGILRNGTSDYTIACWNLKRLAQLLSHMRRWSSSSSSSSSTAGDRDTPLKSSSINFLLSFAQSCLKSVAHVFFRRWSETISTRSFVIECLITTTGRYNSVFTTIRRWCVTPSTYGSKRYNDDIGKFIFTRLQEKARSVEADENAGRDRLELQGDLFLRKQQTLPEKRSMHLPDSYLDLPVDIRPLFWHIATEILYNTRDHQQRNDPYTDQCRETSNLLSQYMMYLTFEGRPITSKMVPYFTVRFHDIVTYIREHELANLRDRRTSLQERVQRVYKKIMDDYKVNEQRIEQPVLLRAVQIAEELMKLNEKELWAVISDEWVEILVYAATHSDPMAHVKKLAEGGELITIVWLLSAHLGFGDYFLVDKQEKEKQEENSQA